MKKRFQDKYESVTPRSRNHKALYIEACIAPEERKGNNDPIFVEMKVLDINRDFFLGILNNRPSTHSSQLNEEFQRDTQSLRSHFNI